MKKAKFDHYDLSDVGNCEREKTEAYITCTFLCAIIVSGLHLFLQAVDNDDGVVYWALLVGIACFSAIGVGCFIKWLSRFISFGGHRKHNRTLF